MGFVTKEKLFSKDFFITYGWLLGGCFMFALGAVLFAEPYGFAPGGTYGLSMVFHHLWGWETEIAALCMDVPLLLLGIYFLGGMFGVKTIICTFAIPAFMRLIHYVYGYDALLEPGITDRTMLNEQLLSAIFGGIVYGIGIGMIFKAQGYFRGIGYYFHDFEQVYPYFFGYVGYLSWIVRLLCQPWWLSETGVCPCILGLSCSSKVR